LSLSKVLDVDSGSNGDIQSVEIISASSSNIGDVRLYFSLRPTPLSQPHAAEYQLQVAESLRDIGHQVPQPQGYPSPETTRRNHAKRTYLYLQMANLAI